MKRLGLLLSLFVVSNCCAQSFHRGAVVFDLNTGIEAYKTTQRYSAASLADTAINSQAANSHLVAGVEIGLAKWLGIGVKGKMNSFFRDVDAVTREKTDLSSTELLVSLNIHPIVRKRFDLLIGADVGFSDLQFSFKNLENASWSSNGIYLAPYINPRVYLGRFGFNLKTNLPFINYNEFKSSGTQNAGGYMIDAWKGAGFGVSVGIQVRLF